MGKDAMVVLWTTPSRTLNPTLSSLRLNTHTPPDLVLATPNKALVLVPSPTSTMLRPPPSNLRLPLLRAQSPLPSKPINLPSKCTLVVSSLPDVDPTLTTVSSPSATVTKMELTTSSSRTPSTNAVSLNLPPTHLPELVEPRYGVVCYG